MTALSGHAQSLPLGTNRFASDLATFTFQQNLVGNGNNIAWSATANAGGAAGEVGGTFARNDAVTAPFVGDLRDSVVPLNLNEVLSFSGRLVLTNVNLDGEFGVGFFDTTSFGTTDYRCLAVRVREPSSSGGPFRIDIRIPTTPEPGANIDLPPGTPASFAVTWQPSGAGDYFGTATLTVQTATTTNTVTRTVTYAGAFNAFGIGAICWTGSTSNPGLTCHAYFDDLIYSVPPSGAPQFLKQPAAPSVLFEGGSCTIYAVVAGDAPMNLQWKKIVGSVTNDVPDATNSVLTISPVALSDAGTYFLQASNDFAGGTVAKSGLVTFSVTTLSISPSFTETAGKVVIEAEHYDRNWVINNNAWLFDTNWPGHSGDGYMVPVATGNRNNTWTGDPHLDYYVRFNTPGTWYVWVRGADNGNRRLSIGLNGSVVATADQIGNANGAFGTIFSGTWTWCGYYGANPANYTRITIPGAGNYILSVFMRNEALLFDQLLLTRDAGYIPSGPETETPASGALRVQVATPCDSTLVSDVNTNGQTLLGTGPKLVAARVSKGANPISKVEFYAGLVGSASDKIGEATAFPWQVFWTNYAIGTNVLTAKVTDSGSATATSATPVYAILNTTPLPAPPPPLYTNDFSTSAKTFTALKNNGVSNGGTTSDFGWRNSANAGGTAGELGGLFYRSQDSTAQFIGVPFSAPMTFNYDGLLIAGSIVISNTTTMDGEVWLGYTRPSDSGNQFGLRLQEPGGSTPDVFRMAAAGGPDLPAPMDTPFTVEVRWQPSPVGDGYLAKTKLVSGGGFGSGYSGSQYFVHAVGPSTPPSTLDGFGIGCWNMSSTDGTKQAIVLVDNVAYVVPPPQLQVARAASQVTLKWPYSVPAYGLWWTPSLEGTPAWSQAGLPAPTLDPNAGSYGVTEAADQAKRFYRLQY